MNTIRLWTQLGAAIALTTGSVAAAADASHQLADQTPALWQMADASGGQGGEGEGAEVADIDDAGFAAQLGYVLGHMRVGTALYAAGETDMAKTHMKHPRDEIYEALEPVLDKRKSPGFAAELDALAMAVEAGAPKDEVETKFKALEAAILSNMPKLMPPVAAKTVEIMLRSAGEDYEHGVKSGAVTDVHEYQDAWGFAEAAKTIMAAIPADERTEHKKQVDAIEAEINGLATLWPDIAGKAPVKGDAKQLFAAAAKIELQGLSIE